MPAPLTIVGLGEAVFDIFPGKAVLGGTSLNLAVQAHQLLRGLGGRGVLLSRIGRDELGQRLLAEFAARQLPTEFIQLDDAHPTGQVIVHFDGDAPRFEIVMDCAWDHIAFGPREAALAAQCSAVSFGSMAQRHPTARTATAQFLDAAPQALRMFDVNLRMDLYSAQVLEAGCRMAQLVKLNEDELPVVTRLLGVDGGDADARAQSLRKRFDLEAVIYTRGVRGTVAYTREGRVERPAVSFAPLPGADAVGAGDACCAGLLAGRLLGRDWPATVDLANRMGAFVASRPTATPLLTDEFLASLALRNS